MGNKRKKLWLLRKLANLAKMTEAIEPAKEAAPAIEPAKEAAPVIKKKLAPAKIIKPKAKKSAKK
jgi:hypothetical protein